MKYLVYGKVVGTKWMGTVEAENEKEAMKLANELDSHVSICHQCADEVDSLEVDEIFVEKDDRGL